MTAATEKDLKRLEDLIIGIANGQKAIENRLTTMENRLTTLENGQKTLELGQSEIKGDIRTLDAKIEGLSDRVKVIENAAGKTTDLAEKVGELKNWKQIGVVVITALLSSILSGVTGGVIGWLIRAAKVNP
jgi:chromosome segregation ATPase